MSRAGAMRTILLAFFIAVAMIAWRDIKRSNVAPAPAEFVGAALVYSLCGLFAEVVPGLGATLAVGWTLGLATNVINYRAPVGSLTSQQRKQQETKKGPYGSQQLRNIRGERQGT